MTKDQLPEPLINNYVGAKQDINLLQNPEALGFVVSKDAGQKTLKHDKLLRAGIANELESSQRFAGSDEKGEEVEFGMGLDDAEAQAALRVVDEDKMKKSCIDRAQDTSTFAGDDDEGVVEVDFGIGFDGVPSGESFLRSVESLQKRGGERGASPNP